MTIPQGFKPMLAVSSDKVKTQPSLQYCSEKLDKFCVYGYFDSDKCFYVGQGNARRPYEFSKSRSKPLVEKLSSCDFEVKILEEGLSKSNAIEKVQELINSYEASGQTLLNIQRKRKLHSDLNFDFCNSVWYLSDESKTGIRWKDLGKYRAKKSVPNTDAGCKTERGYMTVGYNKIHYQVHRIVWVLANGKNLDKDLVVNHIDSNPENNSPSNLVACTQKENSILADRTDAEGRNCSGIVGIHRVKSGKGWLVRWYEEGKEASKLFKDKDYNSEIDCLSAAMSFREENNNKRLDLQKRTLDNLLDKKVEELYDNH